MLSAESWLLAQEADLSFLQALIRSGHFDELVVFGFITLMVAIPIVSGMWYKLRVKEWETALKQTMLDRGMSAEEIRSVLDAGSGWAAGKCHSGRRESAPGAQRTFS